ncbi:MAG: periplasmic heavy metal sensor [Thermoanaerobaculia bacterium]|nr:periplasmic heavy metal sensor [Thermoanaerobaculia bacterium]
MKRLVAILSVLAAAVLARPADAQLPEGPLGKWWKRPVVVRMLNLSSEQQGRLEDIFSRRRREFVDLKADVERRQIDVEELVAAKDSDPKKVAASVDALEQSRLRLRKAATMMFLEQKDVLSAAQWQQILDRRDEWRKERQMGRRGVGGDGPERPAPGTGRQRPPRPSERRYGEPPADR